MPNYSIEQIMDLNTVQELQDAFSEYTGLAAMTTDSAGNQVTEPSGFSSVCQEYIRTSTEQIRKCMECCVNSAYESLKMDGPYIYKCHAGLVCFTAPILLNDRVIGCITSGQVISTDEDERYLFVRLSEMGFDPQDCVRITENVKRITPQELHKAASFLYKIAKICSATAHKNYLFMNRDNDQDSGVAPWLRDYVSSIKHPDHERLFNTSEFFTNLTEQCTKLCAANNAEFRLEAGEGIPPMMLGNAKLMISGIEAVADMCLHFSGASVITVAIDMIKINYSSTLVIDVMTSQLLTEEELYWINLKMHSDELNQDESKNVVQLTDFFVKKLSGTIKAVNLEEKGASIHITVPQLTDKENNNGR